MQSFEAESPVATERSLVDAREAGDSAWNWTVRRTWDYGMQLASLLYLFVGGVLVTLISPIVRIALGGRKGAGAEWVAGLFRGYVRWLTWLGQFEVKYEGLEKVGDVRGAIIAANHPGILDAVFLISRVPRAACIMRASLMRNWAFAGCAKLAEYVPNDRGADSIRQCREKLAAGENLLIFPEGTRTWPGARGVNRFKTGFALTSVLSGTPIHTVLIERQGDYLGKGRNLWLPAVPPIRMTIRTGAVFAPREGESAKELSARLERYFRDELDHPVGA